MSCGDGERHISTNHSVVEQSKSLYWLKRLTLILMLALVIKILASILSEYRWYFPANFHQSFFLTGRQSYFNGWYGTAFYVHIISGPITILLAFVLMLTAGRSNLGPAHRWMGRTLGLLVIFAITPSGLVMATRAITGTFAGTGFAILSLGTCFCVIAAAYHARNKQFQKHQRWANRCFIFLCSPLILRLMSGASIVSDIEGEWTYQAAAWLSWFGPLLIYELYLVTRQENWNRTTNVTSKRGKA